MNYYPGGAPYPQQPYPGAPYVQPGVQYTETTTTYVTPVVAPPPPQVTEVVVVENNQPQFGAGAVLGSALAGMAVGMVVEDALDF